MSHKIVSLSFCLLSILFLGACSQNSLDSQASSVSKESDIATTKVQPTLQPQIEDDSFNVIAGKAPSAAVKKSTVALDMDGALCTGTILSSKYILTASHCVESSMEFTNWKVVFGSSVESQNTRAVVAVMNDNSPFTLAHPDIAIVEFTGGLPKGYVAASLPKVGQSLPLKKNVLIAGFGISKIYPERFGTLLEGKMTLDEVMNDGTLKLKRKGKSLVNLCYGDSGGPTYLTKKNKLVVIGITSYGLDTECLTPTYVTDVRKFLGWIDAKVGLSNLGAGK